MIVARVILLQINHISVSVSEEFVEKKINKLFVVHFRNHCRKCGGSNVGFAESFSKHFSVEIEILILVLLVVQPDLLFDPSDLGTGLEQLLAEFVVALVPFGDGHRCPSQHGQYTLPRAPWHVLWPVWSTVHPSYIDRTYDCPQWCIIRDLKRSV